MRENTVDGEEYCTVLYCTGLVWVNITHRASTARGRMSGINGGVHDAIGQIAVILLLHW